ncbi:phosphatase PAP2 family protein [Halosolutus amylolyticus]|uniref:Phosphatase PAP2 family protein n=1 Tax=Halosolutus amylolyticus TaxID=2932267 RepID=A0ABD5PS44_9EURY|nr:phosphatase PAP2 family protein [Halosolutus amylolyticus]
MRLEEASAAIREAFPEAWVDLAVAITEFGGAAVLMIVLAVLYWLTRRREAALVVSYAVAGVGFILVLKTLIGLPRPPEDVYLIAYDGDPYGFPSGHAFAASLVYGGLLLAFDRYRDPVAIAATGVVIALVSLSRVVLGLHYLGDVIVGALVGLGFLLAVHAVVDGEPRRGFALGAVLGVPAVLVTGGDPDALVALGGSLGGVLASTRLGSLPDLRSRLEGGVLVAVGGTAIGAGVALESIVGSLLSNLLAPAAIVAVNAALFVAILLAPAAVGRLAIGPLDASR